MNLKIIKDDPLKILYSTKYVLENAKFVEINEKAIDKITKVLEKRLKKGLVEAEYGLGATGDFNKDVQLVFIEDVVNFCFWAEKDKAKWQVEWPKGNIINGGWYGLKACFERALAEKVPILDAKYLANIKLKEVKHFFRSSNATVIPLIEKRWENLLEAGKVLLKKYNGKFINVIENSNFDTINLVQEIYENFNSFKDIATYNGRKVYFLKRAQIVANDISYLSKFDKKGNLKNLDKLTAFADYKLLQMLREFDVLVYSKGLAQKVDNYVLIPAGCKEEIEIRAANIWAIELIRQQIPEFSAGQIDNALWLISQDQSKVEKPYHRTYTIYY